MPSGALRAGNVEAFRISLSELRALLATQGLMVVGAKERAVLEACESCFNDCQGMARYSTVESDRYWELAEALMGLTSERLGVYMHRIDEEDKRNA